MTQLDAVIKYVHDYCRSEQIEKLPDICLPSLGEIIDYTPGETAREVGKYRVDIGVYDDPDSQYQGVYSVDLASSNLMLVGSSQTGKTNILQGIVRDLSTKYTPEEVNIYIIDFASMVLKNFDGLNHVGGVVCSNEDEKLKNLFKLINNEIDSRREKLLSVGVSSFTAYVEAGKTDLPFMVLMIDNLMALKELYFQDDDEDLIDLCRESLSVGISIVIANSQTSGISYKYLSNFATKIALFCNDSSEYSYLFEHCNVKVDNIPGRGVIQIENDQFECQTYLAFEGEKEFERVKAIKEYIAITNGRNAGMEAHRIPVIPATLTQSTVLEEYAANMNRKFNVVAGLDYSTVEPFTVNLSALGMLAVSGREGSGRHNWVKYLLTTVEKMYPQQSRVYVVDGVGKKLSSLKELDNVCAYSMVAADGVKYIKQIQDQLQKRYDALVDGDEEALENGELLLLVMDNVDAMNEIGNDFEAQEAYQNIVGRYKSMGVAIIVMVDNINIPYSACDMLRDVRNNEHILYFDDIANMKLLDVQLQFLRMFKKRIELGDGYYLKDNECCRLKTPVCEQ